MLRQDALSDYKVTRPERTKKKTPTLMDLENILAHCSASLRTRITVLACSGLRVGELQGLRKTDIDLERGFITVAGQVSGPTKTRSSVRRIPIHARIRPLLESQLAADRHELLFTALPGRKYPAGGHHIDVRQLNEDFKLAAQKASCTGFTAHSLRRFFNTHVVNAGIPERVVRIWMGHVSHDMTGIYDTLSERLPALHAQFVVRSAGRDALAGAPAWPTAATYGVPWVADRDKTGTSGGEREAAGS